MDGYRLVIPIRPRFRDTDAMGHLNHVVYLTYFEVARAEYWLAMTGDANYQRVPFIFAHATVDFRSPAYVSEVLEVGIRVSHLGTKSFACEYRVEEQTSRRLVCEGRTVQVIFDYDANRSIEMPADLRAKFRRFEGRPEL